MKSIIRNIAPVLALLASRAVALGINCRGSGLCNRAGWNNKMDVSVMQGLRDAVFKSNAPGSTAYQNGQHIICVSQSQHISIEVGVEAEVPEGPGGSVEIGLDGSIGEGGICLFPQNMDDGATITLDTVKPLLDKLLEHTCQVCGSIPIHFIDRNSNDPTGGILTFNYVAAPFCTENCLSGSGGASKRTVGRRALKYIA